MRHPPARRSMWPAGPPPAWPTDALRSSTITCRVTGHAFTLLELLIALAVIATLIAILLPILSEARASARRVHCLSNLRQLYLIHTSYVADHEGRLPATFDEQDANGGKAPWMWNLAESGYIQDVEGGAQGLRWCTEFAGTWVAHNHVATGRAWYTKYDKTDVNGVGPLFPTYGDASELHYLRLAKLPNDDWLLVDSATSHSNVGHPNNGNAIFRPHYYVPDHSTKRGAALWHERRQANVMRVDGSGRSLKPQRIYAAGFAVLDPYAGTHDMP